MMATAFSITGIAPMMLLLQACLMKAAEPILDSVHQRHGDWQVLGAACTGERAILHHSLRCIVNPVGIKDRGSVETARSRGPFCWYTVRVRVTRTLSASPTGKWSQALHYLGTDPYPFGPFFVWIVDGRNHRSGPMGGRPAVEEMDTEKGEALWERD